MENHPIPQDVTGFQFKLIGNMTVKQFAYLATGVVFAWILLQLPTSILIKFPLAGFSAIFGIGLAYFPVSGRPMDLMIGNYVKALLRPTEFIYKKTGGQIYFPNKAPALAMKSIRQYKNGLSPFPKDKLKAYLESLNEIPKNKIDERENNFLMSVFSLATGKSLHQQPAIASNPTIQQFSFQSNPAGFSDLQKSLSEKRAAAAQPIVITQPASPSLQREEPTSPITPLVKPDVPPQLTPIGEIVTTKPALKGFNRTMGMPISPDFPNLITGITKDSRGNALPNILVEVRDKDDNPVRAFKTNELGRFASATPLKNGTYTTVFEDPKAQNKFEKITINVTGQIIMPIEAISIDAREELRKSLFAQNTQKN